MHKDDHTPKMLCGNKTLFGKPITDVHTFAFAAVMKEM